MSKLYQNCAAECVDSIFAVCILYNELPGTEGFQYGTGSIKKPHGYLLA